MPSRKQIRRQVHRNHPNWGPRQVKRRVNRRLDQQKHPWQGYNPVAPGGPSPRIERLIGKAINKQVNAYAKPRQGAITGYTKSLADALGGISPSIGAAYGQAQRQQSTLDTALADRLGSEGEATASTLGQALAAAGQDQHPANAVREQALGAANASFATGSASQSQLIAQGAAAKSYGAKLPGIAALGGLQATKGLQSQAQSMIPELRQEFDANELQKWIARTGLGMSKKELRLSRRQEKNRHSETLKGLKLDNKQFMHDVYQDQIDAAQKAGEGRQDKLKERLSAIDSSVSDAISQAEKLKGSGGAGGGNPLLGGSGAGGANLDQAYKRVYARLRHDLRRYHLRPARLRRLTLYALRQGGYKVGRTGPGREGGADGT